MHDSIITVGNGGADTTRAAFTLFYNQGTARYDLEQTLQPDEQMWIDVGKLISGHAPDKSGNVLPDGLATGSYEAHDLTHRGAGTLFEGKVIYDKTYGHAAYGCALCCGWGRPYLVYDPLALAMGYPLPDFVYAPDECQNGLDDDVSDAFYGSWMTGSTSIATVDYYGTHTGVAQGSTTTQAYGCLNNNDDFRNCPLLCYRPSGPVNVTLKLQTNPYNSLFVGTDPNLASANSIFATVSPTGGTFTTSSSNSPDTFTPVQSGGPGWVVNTTTQSTNSGDRKITVTYTVSGQGSATQSLNETARQFAYATNNTPSNTCTGYGYTYLYVYTPYTHPDGAAVQPGLGLDGVVVTESFNPQLPSGYDTGSGSLDANSEFTDKLGVCSPSPLTPFSITVTQTLSIEGYQVRQNSLTFADTGLTYTSLGPNQ